MIFKATLSPGRWLPGLLRFLALPAVSLGQEEFGEVGVGTSAPLWQVFIFFGS